MSVSSGYSTAFSPKVLEWTHKMLSQWGGFHTKTAPLGIRKSGSTSALNVKPIHRNITNNTLQPLGKRNVSVWAIFRLRDNWQSGQQRSGYRKREPVEVSEHVPSTHHHAHSTYLRRSGCGCGSSYRWSGISAATSRHNLLCYVFTSLIWISNSYLQS